MKTMTNIQKPLLLAIIFIVACSACNKTKIEEVKFPKKIELLVGQYCLPWIVVGEFEPNSNQGSSVSVSSSSSSIVINGDTIASNGNLYTSTLYDHTYIFKKWVSDNTDIAVTRGDTVVALSAGTCGLTALYHDDLGEHTANCTVTVSDPILPNPEDTIFAHCGETVELCSFKLPGSHTVQYELEYGSGYIYSGTLNSSPYHQGTGGKDDLPIRFSALFTYYLNMIMPNFMLTSVRVFCEDLDIDVTIPIVTLPSDESKEP